MASGGLGNLTVDLLLETLQWTAGLNKAEYQAEQFAAAIEKKFNKMVANVGEAAKGVAAGFVAGFAVDRLVEFGNEVQKTADRLDELAQKTGSSVESLGKMSIFAEMGGVSLEAMAQGMAKFNKVATEAFANEDSNAAKVFKSLGVAVKDSSGHMRSAEAIYKDAAKAMGGLKDSAIKTALATALAGKSGADMIPVWNSYAAATKEADEASDNYAKQIALLAPIANEFNDSLTILQTTSKTTAAMIAREFLPYLTELVKAFTDTSKGATGMSSGLTNVTNAFKGIIIVVDFAITLFVGLVKAVIAAGTIMAKFASGDWAGVRDTGFGFISDMGDAVDNAGKRWSALLGTATEVTAEVKKMKDPTDDMARAVAKIPPFKLRIENLPKLKASISDITHGLKEMADAEKELFEQMNLDAKFKDVAGSIELQTKLLGMSRLEVEKYTKQQELLNAAIDAKRMDQYAEQLERLNKAFADREAKANYLQFLNTVEGEWHKAFDAMFDETKGGWDGMLDSMKKSFKKLLLDYLYQAFAKPFLMQVVMGQSGGGGQMSGMNSIIDQYFGGSGQSGGLMNTALDYVSNYFGGGGGAAGGMDAIQAGENVGSMGGGMSSMGGMGSMGGGYAGIAGVAGGLIGKYGSGALGAGERGQQAGMTYGATLAMIGSAFGPIGAAIGAVLGIVIGKATDPDPDAMRKAKFGTTTGATGLTEWQGKSALGSFGFSEGEWLSSEQMGDSMKAFITSIENVDNAFAKFMTSEQITKVKTKLDSVSKVYELGMEHLDVTGLGEVLRDRMSLITHEISEGLGEFVDAFQGPVEDMVGVVDSYLAATAGVDFDPQALIEALQPKSLMETYQANSALFATYVDGVNATADSMGGLVAGMEIFQQATLQMVAAIDAAAESMHAMFQATADGIRQSLMTEEERYKFLQDRADSLFADLMTETDPAKIQDLASRINDDINSAWGMLDETQRSALGEQYLSRLETLDQTVADKMSGLRDVVIEDSDTMMETIAAKLETLFATAATTAATEDAAADKILDAANTMAAGVPVYLVTEAVNGG